MKFGLETEDEEVVDATSTWEEDLEETRRLREAFNLRQAKLEREFARLKEENGQFKLLADQLGEKILRKNETVATLEREKQETENRHETQIKELSAELENSSKRNSELNAYVLQLQNENHQLRTNEKKPPNKVEDIPKKAENFLNNLFGDLKNGNRNIVVEEEDYYEGEDWEVQCYNCDGSGHFARECPSDCRNCEDRHCHPSRDCFYHDPRYKMARYHHGYNY